MRRSTCTPVFVNSVNMNLAKRSPWHHLNVSFMTWLRHCIMAAHIVRRSHPCYRATANVIEYSKLKGFVFSCVINNFKSSAVHGTRGRDNLQVCWYCWWFFFFSQGRKWVCMFNLEVITSGNLWYLKKTVCFKLYHIRMDIHTKYWYHSLGSGPESNLIK